MMWVDPITVDIPFAELYKKIFSIFEISKPIDGQVEIQKQAI